MIEVDLDAGAIEIRGAVAIERTVDGQIPRRVRPDAWARIPDDFMRASVGQSAGVRLSFRTSATVLELTVRGMKMVPDESSELPPGYYDLVVDGELVQQQASTVGSRFVFSFERPDAHIVRGPADTLRFTDLAPTEKNVEIWFPYTDEVELLGLRADARVLAPATTRDFRWVHHGSSISHGYLSSHTTATWPVAVALATALDLTNLAFSGNALLDQLTARTIRDTPADFISLKLGINLVNGDMMRMRIFRGAVHGFLDTIRDGHPSTPILVISPIFCAPVEDVAGPTIQDPGRSDPWTISHGTEREVLEGKLSLGVIRRELERIVRERAQHDSCLFYLNGLRLYGSDDAVTMPLPDNLHPADDVQQLIAERFIELGFGLTGVLGPTPLR